MFTTGLIAWMIRKKKGKFGLAGNVVISNVPGPRKPLFFGAMEVENWFSTAKYLTAAH
ncbi:MAG: diacylglycerol O-acyltransferase [Halioglobus sp.]|jgi:diacylglycerol O-acyltransferase